MNVGRFKVAMACFFVYEGFDKVCMKCRCGADLARVEVEIN